MDLLQIFAADRNKIATDGIVKTTIDDNLNKCTSCPSLIMGESSSKKTSLNQEALEEDLNCTICSNLFIKATTLNCSHSFCEYCILEWTKMQNTCPICRQKITHQHRTLVLDKCVDTMMKALSEETNKMRKDIIEFRDRNSEPPAPPGDIHSEMDDDYNFEFPSYTYQNLSAYIDYDTEEIDHFEDYLNYYDTDFSQLEDEEDDEEYERTFAIYNYESTEEYGEHQYFQYYGDENNNGENSNIQEGPEEEGLSTILCTICFAIGHSANNCPTLPVEDVIQNAQPQQEYAMCLSCNELGHFANECPN